MMETGTYLHGTVCTCQSRVKVGSWCAYSEKHLLLLVLRIPTYRDPDRPIDKYPMFRVCSIDDITNPPEEVASDDDLAAAAAAAADGRPAYC
jgi:hypothetical protein